MKKAKYYVVWRGVNPGIYDNWEACRAQVTGFVDAKFKSFEDKKSAELAFQEGWGPYYSSAKSDSAGLSGGKKQIQFLLLQDGEKPVVPSIAVDAACSGNPGVVEYRGVDTLTAKVLFHYKLPLGTNNIGEFLAIVHALAMLKKTGRGTLPIYSDSRSAINWVKARKSKTSLERNAATKFTFDLMDRAEAWLQKNTYENPILKWKTEIWGEIPADFERK